MSTLSQLAAEIAAAAAAAPLTQAPDDIPSEGDPNAFPSAPRPSELSSSAAAAASVRDYGSDDGHDAPPCSPRLSSTPPPFVAPDMLEPSPPARLTVMPWREQQQCREHLLRAPGLYACWRMHRIVAMYSNSAQNQFHERLLSARITRFERFLAM